MSQRDAVIQHSTVGSIRGCRHKLGVVDQFLGIQYATIPDRFSRGVLKETYPSPLDATTCGPLPVADPKGCDIEHALLQHELPHPEYSFSDIECLRLHVTIPSQEKQPITDAKLPVVVFMHGGGFVTGSASWPQWDLAPHVAMSIECGTPIVAVGINYRLGPFGFLTSAAMREAGYLPNNGLYDQKLGLRWVQRNIAGFGGDPNRVTFLGSSIGGASGFIHLQSEEPLFKQLVALGGSGTIPPIPPQVGELAFGMVMNALGLEALTPAEQVNAILHMPADELNSKVSGTHAPINAVLDNDIIKKVPTFQALSKAESTKSVFPGLNWCKNILMGDAQLDGMILAITALAGRTDNLAQTLEHCVSVVLGEGAHSPSAAMSPALSQMLSEYSRNPDQTNEMMPIINFLGDICFAQGAKACARAWSVAQSSHGTKAFLCHFNVPNPWPGGWKGHATHGLDMAFALQNYNDFMSAGQRACAERMGRDIIAFVNGNEPFAPLNRDNATMVYYAGNGDGMVDESKCVVEQGSEDVGRFHAKEPVVLDKMMTALLMFLQGPQ